MLLGRLKGGQPQAAPSVALGTISGRRCRLRLPSEIAQLLRSPKSIRQAIILNEILQRPEW